MVRGARRVLGALCLLTALPGAVGGQDAPPPLPLGAGADATARAGAPATFAFDAPGPGLLSAVAAVSGDADLVLSLCDEDGQPLADTCEPNGQPNPGARSDHDLLGSRGLEVATAPVPGVGRYLVVVEVAGDGEARLHLSASFAPAPALARPDDPDGRPGAARGLDAGVDVEDAVAPKEGDLRDWFAVRCPGAGALSVVTRAPAGDLRLDAYSAGQYRTPAVSSDDDEQGVAGDESVTVKVEGPGLVLVRVAAVFVASDRVPYRLLTTFAAGGR
jgi:hypothetical protein